MGHGAGSDTRARLIETAAELLWTRSFYSAGVDEICQLADVRKGSFYHFFPSKADLAIEVVRTTWERLRAEVFDKVFAADGSGLDRLRRLSEAVDDYQRREFARRHQYLGCPFGGLGQEMAHQDERLRLAVERVLEGHVDYFERALEQAAAEGVIPSGALRQRARNLLALFEGALLLAKVGNSPDRFSAAMDVLPVLAGSREPFGKRSESGGA